MKLLARRFRGSGSGHGAPGSVLVQVLIMGVLLLILITLLVKSVAQHYQFGAIAAADASSMETTQSSINVVEAAWSAGNNQGQICSSWDWGPPGSTTVNPSDANYVSCTGSPGSCGCTCTVVVNSQTMPSSVTTKLDSSGNCNLSTQQNYP